MLIAGVPNYRAPADEYGARNLRGHASSRPQGTSQSPSPNTGSIFLDGTHSGGVRLLSANGWDSCIPSTVRIFERKPKRLSVLLAPYLIYRWRKSSKLLRSVCCNPSQARNGIEAWGTVGASAPNARCERGNDVNYRATTARLAGENFPTYEFRLAGDRSFHRQRCGSCPPSAGLF